jgi:hypothetical protein
MARPKFHLLEIGFQLRQPTIESGPTHFREITHPLNTQRALHWHHFPNLVVDSVAPDSSRVWRRASILQGTAEKIHLLSLLRQKALKLIDLLAQRKLTPLIFDG